MTFETDGRLGPLREHEIKALVLNKLIDNKRISRNAVLTSELSIFKTKTRADIAILDRHFIGIEIKSELDSLKRLDKQLVSYRSFFDYTILVVSSCHLKEFDFARYAWLELWVLDKTKRIKVLKKGATPSSPPSIDYRSFMTAKELQFLIQRPVKRITKSSIRKSYLHLFEKKFLRSSAEFWDTIEGRPVTPESLRKLSRFRAKREATNSWLATKAHKWNIWLEDVISSGLQPHQSLHVSSVSYKPDVSP